MPSAERTFLQTPPLPLLVPASVFDAFSWCSSDKLEWARPRGRWDDTTPIDGADPSRMVFVLRAPCSFLPKELARLHAFGLGLEEEWALAPYAIDDATDELFARRVPPADLLWLAADNLNALYWGLHDWAHFHNHGPFEERAFNELQCDAAALSWLWRNRARVGLSDERWERARGEVAALAGRRFEEESRDGSPVRALLASAKLRALGEGATKAAAVSADAKVVSEVNRRKTFAIISHPDAGKTTLTEKLLLYGGAIQLAGAVKAKRGRASAVSDWMEMERERGISITTSVMQFPYKGKQLNLLDTPGHADFSEDTYRTLHAADAAVMVLDCAKGVEAQTKKLFRVCKHRKMPIFTFVNKMDRPGREPFDLVGEVEQVLGIGVYPMTWPVYRGATFRGVYHRVHRQVFLFDANAAGSSQASGAELVGATVTGIDDPLLRRELDEEGYGRLREESELLDAAGDAFDRERFEAGEVSPMFFGSAMNNFGIAPFLDSFCALMPLPPGRPSNAGVIDPVEGAFSAFVFKIQANMDKAHRDRVAFMRICSGRYERGMKILHVRTDKEMRLSNPTTFVAQERTIVEDAYAGDVIGVYDPGIFEIGDTLTAGQKFAYEEIPSFAPEYFARVVMVDPLRRKQLKKGLDQLSQEGTIQLYRPLKGREGDTLLGAVGQLQLEVVKYRLKTEYDVEVRLEPVACEFARWLSREDGQSVDMETFRRAQVGIAAEDVRGRPVALFQGDWQLNSAKRQFPEYTFAETARGVIAQSV